MNALRSRDGRHAAETARGLFLPWRLFHDRVLHRRGMMMLWWFFLITIFSFFELILFLRIVICAVVGYGCSTFFRMLDKQYQIEELWVKNRLKPVNEQYVYVTEV
jgi:hypothetical protein